MKFRFILILALLFCSWASSAATILVVESYHADYLWVQKYRQGLQDTLGSEHQLVYYEMDTKRLPTSQHQQRAYQAWLLYQKLSPDLVILADDNALKFLGKKLIGKKTPVVYLGINANPRKYGVAQATNISGVLERPLLKRSVIMFNEIMPIKRALILFDHSETSKVVKQESFYGNNAIKLQGIEVELKLIAKFSNWQQQVLGAQDQGYDIIIPALYHTLVDDSGNHVPAEQVISWTSVNTQVPTFGFWDFTIGEQANIGGFVNSTYEQGITAGNMALRMLKQQKRVPPIAENKGMYIFSRKQLKRWGLQLPSYIAKEAIFVD